MTKKPKKVNPNMEYVPSRYPKGIKSFLTVYYPGGGSKVITVEEISSELIKLPDKKELYTGVPPDVQAYQHQYSLGSLIPLVGWMIRWKGWRQRRMHYSQFGMPFTYNPRNNQFFTDEKKKAILIERGYVIPVQVNSNLILNVMVDYEQEKPTPLWREDKLKQYEALKKTFDELQAKDELPDMLHLAEWIEKNKDKIEAMHYQEMPFFTPEDVSSIDMMRAETFQLVVNKVVETAMKAMSKIGDAMDMLWYFLIYGVSIVVVVLMMLYFANEGVFGKTTVVPGFLPFLMSTIKPPDKKYDPIDYSVGKAIEVLVDPTDRQARTTANINRKVPVSVSALLAYEKRMNELLGTCETIGRPLYPPMTFISDLTREFLHLTPSVASRRADKVLEAFGESKALQRVPDFGPQGASFVNPFLQTKPPDRVDGKGNTRKVSVEYTGKDKK